MKNKNKKRNPIAAVLVAIGVISLLGAAAWYAHLLIEDISAERASAGIVEKLNVLLDEKTGNTPSNGSQNGGSNRGDETDPYVPEIAPDPKNIEMETMKVDDTGYIGIITIPSANLDLPVAYDWDYEKLKVSPCRYAGSFYTNDIVICAHDYGSHFRAIRSLGIGDKVIFKSMDGTRYEYVVTNVETVGPTAIEHMITSRGENNAKFWDLTLFTCNVGGMTRCAVRCERVDK